MTRAPTRAGRRARYCAQSTNAMHTTASTIKRDTMRPVLIRLSSCTIRKRDNGS